MPGQSYEPRRGQRLPLPPVSIIQNNCQGGPAIMESKFNEVFSPINSSHSGGTTLPEDHVNDSEEDTKAALDFILFGRRKCRRLIMEFLIPAGHQGMPGQSYEPRRGQRLPLPSVSIIGNQANLARVETEPNERTSPSKSSWYKTNQESRRRRTDKAKQIQMSGLVPEARMPVFMRSQHLGKGNDSFFHKIGIYKTVTL